MIFCLKAFPDMCMYVCMCKCSLAVGVILQHVVTNDGETLLPQYLGMYRITVNSAETYWMVMRNVFSSTLKMHKKYDLKGSTVDRAASNKEKVCTYLLLTSDMQFVCCIQ